MKSVIDWFVKTIVDQIGPSSGEASFVVYQLSGWGIFYSLRDGTTTLFWFHGWMGERASQNLWPEAFDDSPRPFGTVNAHAPNFLYIPREANPFIDDCLMELGGESKNSKRWRHTSSGIFSIKSFYNFLMDGGIRYHINMNILRGICLRKIKAFTWLVWITKFLSSKILYKEDAISS